MTDAPYDAFAEEYAARVPADPDASPTVEGLAARQILAALGDVTCQRVLDLGCGEGHIARRVHASGGEVTGLDLSSKLLRIARERGAAIEYVHGDAQDLRAFADGAFDLVYSNLALMDISDLAATYREVRRVLHPGGRFVFTLVHPCFSPPGSDVLRAADGRFVAGLVRRYTEEGFWRSNGVGTIRSTVGAHHRMLSTYVNGLLTTGFRLRALAEPTLPVGATGAEAHAQVPPVLCVDAVRE